MDEEGRLKRNKYMLEYNRINKDHINKQQKKNRLKNLDRYKEMSRKANKVYHDKHKDEINARSKERNWNYNKETAVAKRRRYYVKNPSRISIFSAKSRSVKKGLDFDLTEEWFDKMFPFGCAVTGLKLDPNGSKTPWTVHIDRIVPSRGYTMKNCRLVCACYNLAKKHWFDHDVLRMANALVKSSAA